MVGYDVRVVYAFVGMYAIIHTLFHTNTRVSGDSVCLLNTHLFYPADVC